MSRLIGLDTVVDWLTYSPRNCCFFLLISDYCAAFVMASASALTLALSLPQECTWLASPSRSCQRAKPESEFRSQLPTLMKTSTTAWTPSFRRAGSTALSRECDLPDWRGSRSARSGGARSVTLRTHRGCNGTHWLHLQVIGGVFVCSLVGIMQVG